MKKLFISSVLSVVFTCFSFAAQAGFTFCGGFTPDYDTSLVKSDSNPYLSYKEYEIGVSGFSSKYDGLNAGVFWGLGIKSGSIDMDGGTSYKKVGSSYLYTDDDAEIFGFNFISQICLEIKRGPLSIGSYLGWKTGFDKVEFHGSNGVRSASWTRRSLYLDFPVEPYMALTIGNACRLSFIYGWDLPLLRVNFDDYSHLGRGSDSAMRLFRKDDMPPVAKIGFTWFI